MQNNQENNRKIAKNTLLLYFRMFFTIIIGLYTSRVVLSSLGISDYGIYNLVGGVVSMLAFLNVGMSGATQRFITYEMGKGNLNSLQNVFNNAVITHLILGVFIVLILEVGGIWLINNKLVIPSDRLFAANCVYQCSVITFFISVISVPYNACIIAHERMGQFAYISILESVLKLVIAIVIAYSHFDKLICYAILILLCQILIRFIYTMYCKKNFEECIFNFTFDKKLFVKMFSFASWGCIGNMGFSLKDQLSNIILNLFFGTAINAARGVATQVNSIINGFAANFSMAINPQITKEYAKGNKQRCFDLTMAGAKYSFFLLSMITIPVIINIDYILYVWLGNVPDYTGQFVTIILIASCVYSMSHTMSTAILATGHVKLFQSLLAITMLIEVPIAYVILYLGGTPYMALLPCIFTNALSLFLRIYILKHYDSIYSVRYFVFKIFLKNSIMFIVAYLLIYFLSTRFEDGIAKLFITSIFSIILYSSILYVFGLNKDEKKFVVNRIYKIMKKND